MTVAVLNIKENLISSYFGNLVFLISIKNQSNIKSIPASISCLWHFLNTLIYNGVVENLNLERSLVLFDTLDV